MRARGIKPGFYRNDQLAECSFPARLLFPALWMLADREGKLEDRPKKIKAEAFPYDDLDVDALLCELDNHGLIVRYQVGSEKYICIPNFLKHQNPHKREQASEIPNYTHAASPENSKTEPEKAESKQEENTPSPEKARTSPEKAWSSPKKAQPSPEKARSSPADSLFSDSLIPDSRFLIPDSPDSGLNPAESDPPQAGEAAGGVTTSQVISLWNETLAPLGFRKVVKNTPARDRSFKARVAESAQRREMAWWRERIAAFAESEFMLANKAANWLDFDWLLKEANLVKVEEGKYSNSVQIAQYPRGEPSGTWTDTEPQTYAEAKAEQLRRHKERERAAGIVDVEFARAEGES